MPSMASSISLFIVGSIITLAIILTSATAYASYNVTLGIYGFAILSCLFLYNPRYLYYLAIFFTCIVSVIIRLWGDSKLWFGIGEILVILCFFFWCVGLLTKRVRPYPFTSIATDIPLILLIILATTSILWSNDKQFGIFLIGIFYVALAFFIMAVAMLDNFARIKIAVYWYLGIGIINTFLCAWSLSTNKFTYEILWAYKDHHAVFMFNPEEMLRGQGLLHPLGTGYTLSLSLILLIGLISVNRSKSIQIFLGFLAFLMFSAQLSTLSKGPLISLFSGLFVFSLTIQKLKKNLVGLKKRHYVILFLEVSR